MSDVAPVLVNAREAARMLGLDVSDVYKLAAAGHLERRFIGKGTRNFRIPVASVHGYIESLPTEPVEAV